MNALKSEKSKIIWENLTLGHFFYPKYFFSSPQKYLNNFIWRLFLNQLIDFFLHSTPIHLNKVGLFSPQPPKSMYVFIHLFIQRLHKVYPMFDARIFDVSPQKLLIDRIIYREQRC